MQALKLSTSSRAEALEDMGAQKLDLLIIGGGVVGAGCALDAATRGLRVGLVESRDWASGTSSRSSKLIHGGLRYLEMLDFRLVHEALRERSLIMQRLAPHLAHPVPFLYPLTHRIWERVYVGAGVLLYDIMAFLGGAGRSVPHHRHLTRRGALRLAPALRRDAIVGGIQYYDGQVDDARHTMMLVRTAASYGVQVASRAPVVGFLRDGDRVVGAHVHDVETDQIHAIQARHVINATGVWTDETQVMVGGQGAPKVRASKGIHLVVPRSRISSKTGLIFRTEKSVLFVIPWSRYWLVGTTDTDWNLDKAHPAASAADINYLLERVNGALRTSLTREDVVGVYAGLRPLLAGDSDSTAKLSREHIVTHPAPGLVVVAGGKYTTYRVMAKDAVDAVLHEMPPGNIPKSITDRVPLVGAAEFDKVWAQRQQLASSSGLEIAQIEHLLKRYGSLVGEILELIQKQPELREPVPGADRYIAAELSYAVSHEGARHVEDVLARRTRISIEAWDRGVEAAPLAARLLGEQLGWTENEQLHEVDNYLVRVRAELRSQLTPDDGDADAERTGVPDINPIRLHADPGRSLA